MAEYFPGMFKAPSFTPSTEKEGRGGGENKEENEKKNSK